jgi:hypothetical protein
MSKLYVQGYVTLLEYSGSMAANGSMAGTACTLGYGKIVGMFRSDIASETGSGVRIQQSCDGGANYDRMSSSAIATACAASVFDIAIVGNSAKFTWKNGATAASSARLLVYARPI